MQLPILAPAPLVSQHAEAFRDLFENQKQYRHFQNYVIGLIDGVTEQKYGEYQPLRSAIPVMNWSVNVIFLKTAKNFGKSIELLVIQAHKMLQNGDSAKSVFDFLSAKQLAYATA